MDFLNRKLGGRLGAIIVVRIGDNSLAKIVGWPPSIPNMRSRLWQGKPAGSPQSNKHTKADKQTNKERNTQMSSRENKATHQSTDKQTKQENRKPKG